MSCRWVSHPFLTSVDCRVLAELPRTQMFQEDGSFASSNGRLVVEIGLTGVAEE